MPESQLLDPVQILPGPNKPLVQDAVLISDSQIKAFGAEARKQGKALGAKVKSSPHQLLAPCLVDPHSFLEEPFNSRSETLATLRKKAAHAGYGQIALLPRSPSWRDRADHLRGFKNNNSDVFFHLWGGFSKGGKGDELAPHAELLNHGAIGLAEDDSMIPIGLLKRGLSLGEMRKYPVLLAPRDKGIQEGGLVREGVETLRAGWSPDPVASETVPLGQLLELHRQHPTTSMRLMNISTAEGVSMISNSNASPMASVCWWHVITDTASLSKLDLGWRVVPSIGRPKDRLALIQGLLDGTITAIAVHGLPLDEEETKLPQDKRLPGLSGYQLVLPSLWQELIVKSGWKIEQLWEVLSFGPSRMLNLQEEYLRIGSRRWLLFDPDEAWIQTLDNQKRIFCANQPWQGKKILGKVMECGLRNQGVQND